MAAPAQRTAIASPSSRCPDTFTTNTSGQVFFHNSFEVAPQQFPSTNMWRAFHSTGMYPPAGTWGWSANGNGIAGKLSLLASSNGSVPDGDFVLWLESSAGHAPAFVQFTANLPGGSAAIGKTFRMSFLGAQRNLAGVPAQQIVRVTVTMPSGSQVLFREDLRDDKYRKYVSIPFVATSATVGIEIAGIQDLTAPQMAL